MGLLGACVVVLQLATGAWTIALARSGSDMAPYVRRVHWTVLIAFFILGTLQSRSGLLLAKITLFPNLVTTFVVISLLELVLLLYPGDYIRRGPRART